MATSIAEDWSVKVLGRKLDGIEIAKRGAPPVHDETSNPGREVRISTSSSAGLGGDTTDTGDMDKDDTDRVWMIPKRRRVGNKIVTVRVPCTIVRRGTLYGEVTRSGTTGKIIAWPQA